MVTFNGKQYADWTAAKAGIELFPDPAPSATVAIADPPAQQTGPADATMPVPAPTAAPQAKRRSLAEKYRPTRLADVVGQREAIEQLQAFAADPYPAAFILAGGTGTGKTSSAIALAADLGCAVDQDEFGGVYSIASGEHTADALRELWPLLWQRPMMGSGWKIVIVNEVESLNGKIEQLWLDKLESIPASTVIVFTTNAIETLPERFRDRCIGGVIVFEAQAGKLADDARALAGRIWQEETGADIPADVMEKVIQRATAGGKISFRRVVQNMVPLLAGKGK